MNEYRPTIIENRLLVSRLVVEGITSVVLTTVAIALWAYTPPLLPPPMTVDGVEDMVLLDLAPEVDHGGVRRPEAVAEITISRRHSTAKFHLHR
jgi:hypothetical protein